MPCGHPRCGSSRASSPCPRALAVLTTRGTQAIAATKDDAERDLMAAQPALDAALAALNSITPRDITALKALKNPPDVVKRIFDAVLLLRCARVGRVGAVIDARA